MKKLLLILCLALIGCSEEVDYERHYFIQVRDICQTNQNTVYSEYEVEEEVYNEVTETSLGNCTTVYFIDIDRNPREGIFTGYSTESQPQP